MKQPQLKSIHPLLAGTLALCLSAVATAQNVVEVLSSKPQFSTLVTAVTEAGLAETLANAEDITIFAPDNAAFAEIPEADLNALLADTDALQSVLFYHVAPEEIRFREFESGPQDTLLKDSTVDIGVKKFFWFRKVSVDDSVITRANIDADNGIIHRIDKVLDPGFMPVPSIYQIAKSNPDFSTLAGLIEQAGLDRALSNDHLRVTGFAPTNDAFLALGPETLDAVQADVGLLRTILKNHFAFGVQDSTSLADAGKVRTVLGLELPIGPNASSATGLGIDGKPIAAADIPASNGILHVVGEVLVPPPPQSLVDVAGGRDDLSTFVSVLGSAGLAETFDSTRKWPAYTIFAPDNEAFAAVPEDVLNALLADPTGALADVLKLHVVPGRIKAANLYDGQVLQSLSGGRLTVSISEGEVRINNALVVDPDQRAENGILHVIGDVISPEPFTVADYVAGSHYLQTLEAAVDAANLTGALDDTTASLTLFAPLDFAFGKLPEGTLETLLADPEGDLKQILLYHVVGESLDSGELLERGAATTLQGADVEVTRKSFRFWGWRYSIVKVNDARLLTADIEVDNGIVHLIGGVLLPPAGEE